MKRAAIITAFFLLGCEGETKPEKYSRWCCEERDPKLFAACLGDCAGSAATDEGNDIVHACRDACGEAFCVRPREAVFYAVLGDGTFPEKLEGACLSKGWVNR